MLTESEEIIVAQLSKIRRDFKVLTAQWDKMVAAVMATPLFKNLEKLEGQPDKTYQPHIRIAGENVTISHNND